MKNTNYLWTLDQIKTGFDRFYKENGRLPTAPEIDLIDYLPSSRQIQRRFGGLLTLRKQFGFSQTNFSAGKFRVNIASNSSAKGLEFEHQVERLLIEKFGAPFVHTEKRFGDGKNRLDFYVYNATKNFGVDVVFTDSFRDLQKNVNLKISKYISFNEELFFVMGGLHDQTKIDRWIINKRRALPPQCSVTTLDSFKAIIDQYLPFKILSA